MANRYDYGIDLDATDAFKSLRSAWYIPNRSLATRAAEKKNSYERTWGEQL